MSRFKLILAVSDDGFTAHGPDDDMSWTGAQDKFLFKLLTTTEMNQVLLAGRKTASMLPPLPGRRVIPLTRTGRFGYDLADAARMWPNAWLIGGAQVAKAALMGNLVERAYICRNKAVLGSGLSFAPIQDHLKTPPAFRGTVGEVLLEVYQGINRGS